ncbi:FEKKY domain-containing protein [Chryseobacterium wanjuense]
MLKKLSFLFLLIMIFSCKKEEGNYVGGYYWIYGYGLKDMRAEEAAEGISEKWKIKYTDVGGCVVDYNIQKKADALNKKTYAAIARRYGRDWKKI